jgi:hypothetical protein
MASSCATDFFLDESASDGRREFEGLAGHHAFATLALFSARG